MLYFARHRKVVAGVAPEAAPLESFGVEEHHCVARLATVSARTGPECRAHPCLLLSATAVRCLPAYGPRRRTGAGPAHVGCPGYAAPRDYSKTSRRRHPAHLQAWIQIQLPRKLPALFRPVGGY